MNRLRILYFFIGFLMAGFFATWQANLLARGWTISQLSILVSVSLTIGLVLDVPFGVFADRIGNKKTVLTAFVVFALGFLVPSLSSLPLALAACVVSVNIGNALINGALESWSADLQHKREKKISTKFFLGLDQFQRVGMIFGALAIPFVTSKLSHDSIFIWGIYSVVSFGVFLIAFFIPSGKHQVDHNDRPTKHSSILTSKVLILVIGFLFFGFSDGVVHVAFWPKILDSGVKTLFGLGVIQALMSAARLLGSEVWKRTRFIDSDLAPTIALVLSSIPFYLFANTNSTVVSGSLWLVRIFILSLYFPAVSHALQHAFKTSRNRVAVVSLMSTVALVGSIAVTLSIGLLPGFQLANLFRFGAVCSVAAGFFFARFSRT